MITQNPVDTAVLALYYIDFMTILCPLLVEIICLGLLVSGTGYNREHVDVGWVTHNSCRIATMST